MHPGEEFPAWDLSKISRHGEFHQSYIKGLSVPSYSSVAGDALSPLGPYRSYLPAVYSFSPSESDI